MTPFNEATYSEQQNTLYFSMCHNCQGGKTKWIHLKSGHYFQVASTESDQMMETDVLFAEIMHFDRG